jgi:hypothetical protein
VRHQQALGALDHLAFVERGAHGFELVAHGLQAVRLLLHHAEHGALQLAAVVRGRGGLASASSKNSSGLGSDGEQFWSRSSACACAVLRSHRRAGRRPAGPPPSSWRRCGGCSSRTRPGSGPGPAAAGEVVPQRCGAGAPARPAWRRAGSRARREHGGPEKSVNTWKQRSCDSIRCSHCCAALVAAAQRERGGAEGALLPGELLALHEVEHGHQRARNLGVGGAVGRLEHHRPAGRRSAWRRPRGLRRRERLGASMRWRRAGRASSRAAPRRCG